MNLSGLSDMLEQETTPLVRTDFSDDQAWSRVVELVTAPVNFGPDRDPDEDPDKDLGGSEGDYGDYAPNVTPVEDRAYAGATGESLAAALDKTGDAGGEAGGYVLLADAQSMAEANAAGDGEVTVVYVDLSCHDPEDAELFETFMGKSFRCVTTEIAAIEANLSIANMDFSEFADNSDPDGVFRGFPAGA